MYKYSTDFNLFCRVNDQEAAQEYLDNSSDEMLTILKENILYVGSVTESIKWILDDSESGHIEVITTQELSEDDLSYLSRWVNEQHSDGIGEGFEQQDFAVGLDDEGDEAIASFDWDTNDYPFERI